MVSPAIAGPRRLERDRGAVVVGGGPRAADRGRGQLLLRWLPGGPVEVGVAVLAVLLDLDGEVAADDGLERLVEVVDAGPVDGVDVDAEVTDDALGDAGLLVAAEALQHAPLVL